MAKIIGKVSRALERPYEELLLDLPEQARLNVDETGHKRCGQRHWTWCFRAGLYTLFKIDPTRSADVLIEVLYRKLSIDMAGGAAEDVLTSPDSGRSGAV